MSPKSKTVYAHLDNEHGKDILTFDIGEGYKIDLGSSDSQNTIKNMFSTLLCELIKQPIEVTLIIQSGYNRALFAEVAAAYVKDLNKELTDLEQEIPEQLRLK